MSDEESADVNSDDATTDDTSVDETATPTWAELFARGEAVGATESEVRETLRSRRDA